MPQGPPGGINGCAGRKNARNRHEIVRSRPDFAYPPKLDRPDTKHGINIIEGLNFKRNIEVLFFLYTFFDAFFDIYPPLSYPHRGALCTNEATPRQISLAEQIAQT